MNPTLRFLATRTIAALFTLVILATATFFLMRLAPGGPFDQEHEWPAEIKANIDARYGLDRPLTEQFLTWGKDVLHGDLRESFQYLGRPVQEIIGESLPTSALLGFAALLLSVIVGIPLGCLGALRRNTWIDYLSVLFSVAGISLPSFLVASLLILVFALSLGWLPPALLESPASWVLPIITLSLRPLAMIARLTRSSLIEVLDADFIRTAHGKGLSPVKVIFKHALKNALIPVITLLGPLAASLITGSFVIEVVFQIPGVGKYFVNAVLNRDYPLVMGITLMYGIILSLSNLLTDLAYGWVDPRVRMEAT